MTKKTKLSLFYISIFIFLITTIYIVHYLSSGHLDIDITNDITTSNYVAQQSLYESISEEINEPISILILQIAVILFCVKICGGLCRKINQPTVVGEILAGILLGPSFLGLFFPSVSSYIFPQFSLKFIEVFSEIGLILFMFIVGLELKFSQLKKHGSQAVIISHSAIMITFAFGFILSLILFETYGGENTPFLSFALFMGISMSITAFPVLARIVHERGLNKKNIGNIILTCAAIDDITAWCILATVIAIVKSNSPTGSLSLVLMTILYLIIMFRVVKPLLYSLAKNKSSKQLMHRAKLMIYFIVMFLSAYATQLIGIHALFGAFVAGVIMPINFNFREHLTHKIEDVTLLILLPLFFVYTGLKTQIGLINDLHSWLICILIVFVAISGKVIGSFTASRIIGLNYKNSSIISVLMNTRGLMELVVLNIGLDLGVLSPKIFSMMVIMAIVTTFMTSPLLNLIDKLFKNNEAEDFLNSELKVFCVKTEDTNFMKSQFIANLLMEKNESQSINKYEKIENENTTLSELEIILNNHITENHKLSERDIKALVKYLNENQYNFLLLNDVFIDVFYSQLISTKVRKLRDIIHSLNFKKFINTEEDLTNPNNILLNKIEYVSYFFESHEIGLAALIDRNFSLNVRKMFIPILSDKDELMGKIINNVSDNLNSQIMLWDDIKLSNYSMEFAKHIRSVRRNNPYHYQLWKDNMPIDINIMEQYDLIIISLSSWKIFSEKFRNIFHNLPSILILNLN